MLRLNQLRKAWRFKNGEFVIVSELCLEFPKSGRVAILGSSGSGKSTLLRLIAGLERADGGSITLNDDDNWRTPGRVVLLPQRPPLFPWLTVLGNLKETFRLIDRPISEIAIHRIVESLQLTPYLERRPYELSGGWRHVAAFAMAILPAPDILLLDEPFANVDDVRKMRLWNRLKGISEDSSARLDIVVTHDVFEAVAISDEIILCSGPPLTVVGRLRNNNERSSPDLDLVEHIRRSLEDGAGSDPTI